MMTRILFDKISFYNMRIMRKRLAYVEWRTERGPKWIKESLQDPFLRCMLGKTDSITY